MNFIYYLTLSYKILKNYKNNLKNIKEIKNEKK
jgi:hypothetical protein